MAAGDAEGCDAGEGRLGFLHHQRLGGEDVREVGAGATAATVHRRTTVRIEVLSRIENADQVRRPDYRAVKPSPIPTLFNPLDSVHTSTVEISVPDGVPCQWSR